MHFIFLKKCDSTSQYAFFSLQANMLIQVKSLRQTAIKYAKTWLLMDAASSVPAETASMIAEALARGTSNGSDVSSLSQLKIIRMLRLAKLLRLVKIARILEDIEFNFPFLIVVP
jgi:hypothetical protein